MSICPACASEFEPSEGVVVRIEEINTQTREKVVSKRFCSEACGDDYAS